MRRLAVPAAAVLVAACRSILGGGDDVCLTYAAPAITMDVLDSVSRAPIAGAGTLAIARDGAYADTVRVAAAAPGAVPVVALARERAGTYEVTVSREGYRDWRRAGVTVTRGDCHVRTVFLTALLQRLP